MSIREKESEQIEDALTLADYYQKIKQELTNHAQKIADTRNQILIAEEAERAATRILDKLQIQINKRLKELKKQEICHLDDHQKTEIVMEELDNIRNQIQILQPLSEIQPSSIALGKVAWAKYFGDVGAEPPFPKDIEEILNGSCPIWPGKKIHQTHLLVLVPQKIDGQLFTLRVLGELVKNPRQGISTRYQFFCPTALKQYGDIPSSTSHWVLMTRNVIPISKNQTHESCVGVIEEYKKYEMPKALDVATALFLEYMSSGIRLYNDNPSTYTHCQEPCAGYHLLVGCFAPSGLYLNSDSLHLGDYVTIGVGAARKLE